jgi:hypothetical protein
MVNFIELTEAATDLEITPDQLVEMRSNGDIRGFRDGTSWKFKEDEIERLREESGTGDVLLRNLDMLAHDTTEQVEEVLEMPADAGGNSGSNLSDLELDSDLQFPDADSNTDLPVSAIDNLLLRERGDTYVTLAEAMRLLQCTDTLLFVECDEDNLAGEDGFRDEQGAWFPIQAIINLAEERLITLPPDWENDLDCNELALSDDSDIALGGSESSNLGSDSGSDLEMQDSIWNIDDLDERERGDEYVTLAEAMEILQCTDSFLFKECGTPMETTGFRGAQGAWFPIQTIVNLADKLGTTLSQDWQNDLDCNELALSADSDIALGGSESSNLGSDSGSDLELPDSVWNIDDFNEEERGETYVTMKEAMRLLNRTDAYLFKKCVCMIGETDGKQDAQGAWFPVNIIVNLAAELGEPLPPDWENNLECNDYFELSPDAADQKKAPVFIDTPGELNTPQYRGKPTDATETVLTTIDDDLTLGEDPNIATSGTSPLDTGTPATQIELSSGTILTPRGAAPIPSPLPSSTEAPDFAEVGDTTDYQVDRPRERVQALVDRLEERGYVGRARMRDLRERLDPNNNVTSSAIGNIIGGLEQAREITPSQVLQLKREETSGGVEEPISAFFPPLANHSENVLCVNQLLRQRLVPLGIAEHQYQNLQGSTKTPQQIVAECRSSNHLTQEQEGRFLKRFSCTHANIGRANEFMGDQLARVTRKERVRSVVTDLQALQENDIPALERRLDLFRLEIDDRRGGAQEIAAACRDIVESIIERVPRELPHRDPNMRQYIARAYAIEARVSEILARPHDFALGRRFLRESVPQLDYLAASLQQELGTLRRRHNVKRVMTVHAQEAPGRRKDERRRVREEIASTMGVYGGVGGIHLMGGRPPEQATGETGPEPVRARTRQSLADRFRSMKASFAAGSQYATDARSARETPMFIEDAPSAEAAAPSPLASASPALGEEIVEAEVIEEEAPAERPLGWATKFVSHAETTTEGSWQRQVAKAITEFRHLRDQFRSGAGGTTTRGTDESSDGG